jgi:hypothetical protein
MVHGFDAAWRRPVGFLCLRDGRAARQDPAASVDPVPSLGTWRPRLRLE